MESMPVAEHVDDSPSVLPIIISIGFGYKNMSLRKTATFAIPQRC
jgi:hypothetical protein